MTKTIQRRLAEIEESQKERKQVCVAFFCVRREHEDEDVERQKLELKEFLGMLPAEVYFQVWPANAPGMTYESFIQKIRMNRSFNEWWEQFTVIGIPCREYKDAFAKLKKLEFLRNGQP